MSERNSSKSSFFDTNFLSELSCSLFPGRAAASAPFLQLNNKTYTHWNEIWSDILQLPPGTSLSSDNFLRQDAICSIHYQGLIVGMIAGSFFNFDQLAYRDHSYLRAFPQERLRQDCKGDASNIRSIEYLSVDNRFRKSKIGFSIGSILLGLSMKIFAESRARIVLGTARSKIHVDEMCYKFGFTPCGEMDKFGHPCTLILNSKNTLKDHDDPIVYKATQDLWNKRTSYFKTRFDDEINTQTVQAA
jgi:hypothetical protein